MPEGPHDAPDSGGGKLEDPGRIQAVHGRSLTLLQQRGVLQTNATLGSIIPVRAQWWLSGDFVHRRSGRPDCAGQEVWLFDALYAQETSFGPWADKTSGRLLNFYTDGGERRFARKK